MVRKKYKRKEKKRNNNVALKGRDQNLIIKIESSDKISKEKILIRNNGKKRKEGKDKWEKKKRRKIWMRK